MEILEINRSTLSNLYEQFPDSLGGLSLKGKYLIYNGEKVDISEFNINDLLGSETAFASSLNVLSAKDIFTIIKLHSLFVASKNKNMLQKKDNNEDKIEAIKEENPLMHNISIVKKKDGVITTEYFNIVDSNGDDHLFINDRNVDIFSIYEALKARNNGLVTPDELIEAINRRLHRIELETARYLDESDKVSEDFTNKINSVNEPYRDEKSVRVYGNEAHDIAVVTDDRGIENHEVVTFNKDEDGNLVTERHVQNGNKNEKNYNKEEVITDNHDASLKNKKNKNEIVESLISEKEFYRLLDSNVDLTEEEKKSVNLFYAYIGDLVLYEAYLLPELMNLLNRFRNYIYHLQYENDEETKVNAKQQEAINKAIEFESRKNDVDLVKDPTLVNEEVQKLTLKYNNMDAENKGVISTLLVLSIIIVTAIILMIITFSVI